MNTAVDAKLASLPSKEASLPSKEDSALARDASRALAKTQPSELRVRLDDGQELTLPKSATRLIAHLLTEMAQGNAVTIIPIYANLTTQEAAELSYVSRPYLIGLLQAGKIPYQMVGTHRRVRFEDLVAFKTAAEHQRLAVMEDLDSPRQEDMGY